jgi:hypothetical protein
LFGVNHSDMTEHALELPSENPTTLRHGLRIPLILQDVPGFAQRDAKQLLEIQLRLTAFNSLKSNMKLKSGYQVQDMMSE